MIFEQGDGPVEKAGSIIGILIMLTVYALLAWTVVHTIMN